jgi:hypothetical protein
MTQRTRRTDSAGEELMLHVMRTRPRRPALQGWACRLRKQSAVQQGTGKFLTA